jgi:hypothetical protein
VPFQGPLHFDGIAVIRSDKIRADQQQDNVGPFQVVVNLLLPLLAGLDLPVVPSADEALPLEQLQVRF